MIIYPDIQSTPDCPTIKFNQPQEQIDLDIELPKILHSQGWGCGTLFNIIFLNHEKTKLLACGRFVVAEEIETLHTNDANPYQPMTRTVYSRRAEQIGGWWHETSDLKSAPETRIDDPAQENETVLFVEAKRRGRPPKSANVAV